MEVPEDEHGVSPAPAAEPAHQTPAAEPALEAEVTSL
jgi:hypothetical protein